MRSPGSGWSPPRADRRDRRRDGPLPTAAHLGSWAKFTPIDHQSAGTKKRGATGRGNPWLAGTLGEIVAALARTDTFLGERYRRLARRRGKHRAIVAVGNSVLTIVWHLLADPQARYQDLGPDFYWSQVNQRRRERDLVRQLEHLTGKKVILQPHPSNPPPDPSQPPAAHTHHRTRLRCAAPGAAACPLTVGFSGQLGPWATARPWPSAGPCSAESANIVERRTSMRGGGMTRSPSRVFGSHTRPATD